MSDSLRSRLDHEPRPLLFGTSGRRGEVVHLTQLEVSINCRAEIEHLLSLPPSEGGIARGDPFYVAHDLRPSSTRFVPEQGGRGEIVQAVVEAVRGAGLVPAYLGAIPTPALTLHGIARRRGSIMVTGSHIPFDRNGYKTNSPRGELRKEDEGPIGRRVEEIRARLYAQPFDASPFDASGRLKAGHRDLPPESVEGREGYVRRYLEFFGGGALAGLRIVAYQHSAVGRDILVEVLGALGAEVIPAGRSETFVAIDTEAIDDARLDEIRALAEEVSRGRAIDAVVSTDGDSDRPLLLGTSPSPLDPPEGTSPSPLDPPEGTSPSPLDPPDPPEHLCSGRYPTYREGGPAGRLRARFFGGDLVGMVTAEELGAGAVVVPISANDGIDRGSLAPILEPKTRIGSPYVIAGMERAIAGGKRRVCGWEANGGFLTASDIDRSGRILRALPTRDALLPILCVLSAMKERALSMEALFARLPARFGRSALVRGIPRETGAAIVRRFSPADREIREARFEGGRTRLRDAAGKWTPAGDAAAREAAAIREDLAGFFGGGQGFGGIAGIDWTDGVRVRFSGGDVAHLRPSGNADELRIYAAAGTQERADAIARAGAAEPDGILRRLAREAEEKGIGG